jgi:hypothetical protein
MKKSLLALPFLFLSIFTHAQKTEFGISLNSGLFSFAGGLAESSTSINYDSSINSGSTNNPYGSKSGLSYGISANIKQVTKKNLVLGIDLGYEVLRSKISINSVWSYDEISAGVYYDANGQTFLNNDFINLFPQIGYRFKSKKVSFDLVAGSDIAFCLNATEKGEATATNGIKYNTNVDRKTINKDFRPRIQLTANYKKAGVYAGYSYGLTDYTSDYLWGDNLGDSDGTYSRFFRFGLTYLLK